jgi:hypothetical protein
LSNFDENLGEEAGRRQGIRLTSLSNTDTKRLLHEPSKPRKLLAKRENRRRSGKIKNSLQHNFWEKD